METRVTVTFANGAPMRLPAQPSVAEQAAAAQARQEDATDAINLGRHNLDAALDILDIRIEQMRDATRAWLTAEADVEKCREQVGALALDQVREAGRG
jgi:hypothetical protein